MVNWNITYRNLGYEQKPCILTGQAYSNPAPVAGNTYNTGNATTTFTNTDNIWSYVYICISKVYFPVATKYEWSTGTVTLQVQGEKDSATTILGTYTGNAPYNFTNDDFEQYKFRLDIKDYDKIIFTLKASGTASGSANQAYSSLAGNAKYEFH